MLLLQAYSIKNDKKIIWREKKKDINITLGWQQNTIYKIEIIQHQGLFQEEKASWFQTLY